MFRVLGLRFWGFWVLVLRVWGLRFWGWVQVTELGVILGYFARTLVRTSIVSLEKGG